MSTPIPATSPVSPLPPDPIVMPESATVRDVPSELTTWMPAPPMADVAPKVMLPNVPDALVSCRPVPLAPSIVLVPVIVPASEPPPEPLRRRPLVSVRSEKAAVEAPDVLARLMARAPVPPPIVLERMMAFEAAPKLAETPLPVPVLVIETFWIVAVPASTTVLLAPEVVRIGTSSSIVVMRWSQ